MSARCDTSQRSQCCWVWLGKTSDGVLPGLFSAAFLVDEGMRDATYVHAMRYEDEDDRKKPKPVRTRRKGENPAEAEEHAPWSHGRKDDLRDYHRHVRC